mgnify:CR=1 FL=1
MNHLSDSFLDKIKALERITNVKQRALKGSNLTQGACTNIGRIIKKEDQILKEIGLDKKVFSEILNFLSNIGFKLSFTSRFFVITSSNALRIYSIWINLDLAEFKFS